MPILNARGDHIKKRRLELGLTQAGVAAFLGVAECTVTNWEKHRTNPVLRPLHKIIEFLGYDPMPGDTQTLAEKLLQHRKRRGISQREFARLIEIDPTTLSRIERGKGKSLPITVKRIETFLEVK